MKMTKKQRKQLKKNMGMKTPIVMTKKMRKKLGKKFGQYENSTITAKDTEELEFLRGELEKYKRWVDQLQLALQHDSQYIHSLLKMYVVSDE